jgi:DNA adenine methylase
MEYNMIKDFMEKINNILFLNIKLEKENEKLKKENEKLKKENEKLKKENEKLKKKKERKIIIEEIIDETKEPLEPLEPLNPLFKWSGGKKDEIKFFKHHFPKEYNIYLEPFFGGGALLCYLRPRKSAFSDVHTELIDFYKIIKNKQMDKIYKYMENHPNNEKTYYEVRALDRNEKKLTQLENACRFYYIRKTCYRGMSRYNKKGEFNIPFGKYKNYNYTNLLDKRYEELLQNTDIHLGDFEYIFKTYDNENNFMFLDPPYDCTFTDYGYCSFGKPEHIRLSNLFKKSKCKCLLVIGATDFIRKLYKGYIVEEFHKNYRFRLHSNRIKKDDIDKKHLIIKNY